MNKTCLQAITGSHAYGLSHKDSDTDRMGIFIAPTENVAGLYWGAKDESWSDAGPTGDDNTKHEIGKFLRLVLKSNPTLIELLFMNDYEILDDVGQGMIDLRSKMLYTTGIRNAYLGYAVSQHSRVLHEYPNHKLKMARHCLRIANQATELLTTGEFDVKVADPEFYFSLDEMPFDELNLTLEYAVQSIKTANSVLPDRPDIETIDLFLKDVRKAHLG